VAVVQHHAASVAHAVLIGVPGAPNGLGAHHPWHVARSYQQVCQFRVMQPLAERVERRIDPDGLGVAEVAGLGRLRPGPGIGGRGWGRGKEPRPSGRWQTVTVYAITSLAEPMG
jgi:hypothetical protein